ncbi:hypothetical protein [Selenomonas sp. F0473]|uniref:hypothetical protein n=1 Tax=Selenomonas sp. F0473 TaxID=999423 RepID=UPI0018DBE444|nr:hypothetical protein [Selenomonas sp. F0473]
MAEQVHVSKLFGQPDAFADAVLCQEHLQNLVDERFSRSADRLRIARKLFFVQKRTLCYNDIVPKGKFSFTNERVEIHDGKEVESAVGGPRDRVP